MKQLKKLSLAIMMVLGLNSCGVNIARVYNHNSNATQVQLTRNNYKVTDKVTGTAEVSYVLIFGGMDKKRLFQNAYADMVNNANITAGSKALVNVVTEEHVGGVPPLYYTRTLTVSANVIEFTN
ncbi:MAG: hypothetical protein RIB47_08140 [Cyclobacteriaceae bacterium]